MRAIRRSSPHERVMSEPDRDTAAATIRRWHATTGHAHLSVLRWHRTVGYARHDGVSVDMIDPPGLAWARDAQDIEYMPDHCERAYEAERARYQFPPILR